MKIIDFDMKFFDFAQKWVAAHPGLTEDQIEESYNQMMQEWLETPAAWLDGATPSRYFEQFSDPSELIEGMRAYFQKGCALPEPLYSRIVSLGEAVEAQLYGILTDETADAALRAEAMVMLRDTGSRIADGYLIETVCRSEASDPICDVAAEIVRSRGAAVVPALMDAYDAAPAYAQMLILEICCDYPGDERIYAALMSQLRNDPEHRALYASYLAKLGDERALEPLRAMLSMYDIDYLDYLELRNAVEALGGDPGEERSFYGDPTFEALRNL